MNGKRLPHGITALVFLAFIVLGLACASTQPSSQTATPAQTQQTRTQSSGGGSGSRNSDNVQVPAQASGGERTAPAPSSPFFSGNGGRGMSIAILAPRATGLEENQSYLPALVQGEFVSNFSEFSAISVLDRQRLDDQYAELLSGYYDDNAQDGMDLGRLTPTTHIMGGTITRTATGYALQIQITRTADKMTAASYSGTLTFAELDNLIGIRRASADLLQKMGVTLTARSQRELAGAAPTDYINARTTLAQGITAQRQGAELEALAYFIQAVKYDEGLVEAENRLNILTAGIASGSAGADARSDIALRRQWIQRLQDAEDFFTAYTGTPHPYYLVYETDIKHGAINYQNDTVNLSFWMSLYPDVVIANTINQVITTVGNSLAVTGKEQAWELDWPARSISTPSPFTNRTYNLSVVVEILNDQGRSIGRHTVVIPAGFTIYSIVSASVSTRPWEGEITIPAVDVNLITDRLTIQISSIDGVPAENAARQRRISIMSSDEYFRLFRVRRVTAEQSLFRVQNNGTLTGYTGNEVNVVIPHIVNGIYVTAIGDGAFRGKGLNSVIIPNTVRSIGEYAFYDNQRLLNNRIILPDSVRSIGNAAFIWGYQTNPSTITIGTNVDLSGGSNGWYASLGYTFYSTYNNNGKRAGTYRRSNNSWNYSSR